MYPRVYEFTYKFYYGLKTHEWIIHHQSSKYIHTITAHQLLAYYYQHPPHKPS